MIETAKQIDSTIDSMMKKLDNINGNLEAIIRILDERDRRKQEGKND